MGIKLTRRRTPLARVQPVGEPGRFSPCDSGGRLLGTPRDDRDPRSPCRLAASTAAAVQRSLGGSAARSSPTVRRLRETCHAVPTAAVCDWLGQMQQRRAPHAPAVAPSSRGASNQHVSPVGGAGGLRRSRRPLSACADALSRPAGACRHGRRRGRPPAPIGPIGEARSLDSSRASTGRAATTILGAFVLPASSEEPPRAG
jgi:hypothetical protein